MSQSPTYHILLIMIIITQGTEVAERINMGKASWQELFKKHDFFDRYKYYLQAIASSENQEKQRLW